MYPNSRYPGPKVQLDTDYFKARVCTIWVHEPLGKDKLGLKCGSMLAIGRRCFRKLLYFLLKSCEAMSVGVHQQHQQHCCFLGWGLRMFTKP